MDSQTQLTALKGQSNLAPRERAELSCAVARQLERAGEYEAASEALIEFWPDRDQAPKLSNLGDLEKADVLLRIGALAGWLGSADQTTGSQDRAKNLITRSIEIFDALGESNRLAEARSELGLCYWREGAFDEARISLTSALDQLPDDDEEVKARILIRLGMVELRAGRPTEAFRFHNMAAEFVDRSSDPALKGTFHNQLATLYEHLRTNESHEDYTDRALMEYTAASFHFEEAGNERYLARVENNLGYLFFTIGKYSDAHSHLERARHRFLMLKDKGAAAQVDDTRARTLLAQGHFAEAERIARHAVRVLERGGQQALLAEALTTQGVALARSGNQVRAMALVERAIEVAETIGDLEGAGRAKLSLIEEFGDKISVRELLTTYRSAIDLLKSSQDPGTGRRLISCADALFNTLEHLELKNQTLDELTWQGFSFKQHVKESEKAVLQRALRDAGGSVTRAARLLGFRHHQSLISLLNTRHKELLGARTKIRKRRHRLFKRPLPSNQKVSVETIKDTRLSHISILHVEDQKAVSDAVQDVLRTKGLRVDSCVSGSDALEILKSRTPYDLVVVDNDLPGLSGLELVLRLQAMPHRRQTPVIMLTGDECEAESWRAGVKAFLRKPEGIYDLAATIDRLLKQRRDARSR